MESINEFVEETKGTAVFVSSLSKYFNGVQIVQNLNMDVKEGSIYCLLGASGCGKTTILSCIVGLQKWESGELLVFGNTPGSKSSGIHGRMVGYMPQDIALYEDLTIVEMMEYYGKIFNMSKKELNEKQDDLIQLLNLTIKKSDLIRNLSGGQKRRASLALALIHSPKLLVLDEPTVGLDPVLREIIWNYLLDLTIHNGSTVIVTTHYMDEARFSNMIGIMRNGTIIEQDTRSKLAAKYNSVDLEYIALEICRRDEQTRKNYGELGNYSPAENHNLETIYNQNDNKSSQQPKTLSNFPRNEKTPNAFELCQYFKKTFALTWVIFLTLFRYPGFLATVLLTPAGTGTLSLLVIGSKPLDLPLGVVNYEVLNWPIECHFSQISQNITTNSSDSNYDFLQILNITSPNSLSCKFINEIRKDVIVKLIQFNSEADARKHVKRGNLRGYVTFSSNFSLHFVDLLISRRYSLNDTLDGSRIHVHLDYSEYVARYFITKAMLKSFETFMRIVARAYGVPQNETNIPLNFGTPIYGDNVDNFTSYVIPGVQIVTMFVIDGLIAGLILLEDRQKGTLNRATAAGQSFYNVILAHILVQMAISLIQLAMWSIVIYFLFQVPIRSPIYLYIFLSVLPTLCGVSFGILLGIRLNNQTDIILIGLFISNVMILCGGTFWPPETMTHFWQQVSKFVPTNLPTRALRSAALKGSGMEDPMVWLGALSATSWIAVFLTLSIIFYKLKFNSS